MKKLRLPPPKAGEIVIVKLQTFDRGYSCYSKKKLIGHCKDLLLRDVELIVFPEKHFEWSQNPLKRPKEYLHLAFAGIVVDASDDHISLPDDLIEKFVELEYNPVQAASFIIAESKEVKPVRRAKYAYLTTNNFYAVNPR